MPDAEKGGVMELSEAWDVLSGHCMKNQDKLRTAYTVVVVTHAVLERNIAKLKAENADLRERLGDLLAVPELKVGGKCGNGDN